MVFKCFPQWKTRKSADFSKSGENIAYIVENWCGENNNLWYCYKRWKNITVFHGEKWGNLADGWGGEVLGKGSGGKYKNPGLESGKNIRKNRPYFLVKIWGIFRLFCDLEAPPPLAFGLFATIQEKKESNSRKSPRNKGWQMGVFSYIMLNCKVLRPERRVLLHAKNISTQEASQKEGAWVPEENVWPQWSEGTFTSQS